MVEQKTKRIYLFEEGNAKMKDLLGGKGSGLAEMTNAKLPVPAGFTITTEVCNEYYELGGKMPDGLTEEMREKMKSIENKAVKQFGGVENPLLVSVRSGAKFSMPGMMDTILNLGLNGKTIEGLIKQTKNERFAYDSYRRFIQMFSNVVKGLDKDNFEAILHAKKEEKGIKFDVELTTEDLKELVIKFKAKYKELIGEDFPEEPYEQLNQSVEAVFRSWNNHRAIVYREKEKIPHNLGTAVNVQAMVFGNMGDDSGTGVAFTRDPATGEKLIFGDYLVNAQGEDVVAGIRTPMPIKQLEDTQPAIYQQFVEIADLLEKHYRDMQDMELTVEKGKLYMLQTRSGKRTAPAAVKIAVDLVKEGIISKEEAVSRIKPDELDQLLHPYFSPKDKEKALEEEKLLAKGTPASPGAAVGIIVFDADEAKRLAEKGEKVMLVRPETTPDDAHGMLAAQGILTSTGGRTSHAAVVARSWGKPCIVGCEAMKIDLDKKVVNVKNFTLKAGEYISIDGATGEVMLGKLAMIKPTELGEDAKQLLLWADEIRDLGVFANADYPIDARRAREFGAEGIGLCRTEHMFMEQDRLPHVQEMIMAKTSEERKAPLEALLPIQREDFKGILKAMEGLPVTIRLLDPPLHEFLPSLEDLLVEVTTLRIKSPDSEELKEKERVLARVRELHEFNPMLGLRVCRLGIVFPEIYMMQVQAIFEAACELVAEGVDARPEVMIPGVGHVNEMAFTRDMVVRVAERVIAEKGITVHYKVGTMIELPRACVVADQLAVYAEFFSFGTNDLTQTTYGYSRDDAEGSFIPVYVDKHILKDDPFIVLDREGVGSLMKEAYVRGRKTRGDLKIGICGEHGGEPSSIEFCHMIKLNYVSCSPYRVPIARLAAAHAKLNAEQGKSAYDTR